MTSTIDLEPARCPGCADALALAHGHTRGFVHGELDPDDVAFEVCDVPLEEASDLYSLAMIAYELATGEALFKGSVVAAIVARITGTPALDALERHGAGAFAPLLARLSSAAPSDRGTSHELRDALAAP